MKQAITEATFAGGTTTTLNLQPGYLHLQLEFIGRGMGTVTVTVLAEGGDAFSAITHGNVNLSNHRTLLIQNVALEAIQFADAGTGTYSVRAKQYGVVSNA